MKHAFIPADAAPGYYGYGGLINIGVWPITLAASSTTEADGPASAQQNSSDHVSGLNSPHNPTLGSTASNRKRSDKPINGQGPPSSGQKSTMVSVFLSEEPHFDVVLGRSFLEKRQIKIDPTDMTDVTCMDTGEKVHCELVILKDGRGEIVTVT